MMQKKKTLFLLIGLLLIGLILRLNNLAGRSLWSDEFFTLFLSTGHGVEVKNIVESIPKNEVSPLLKTEYFRSFLKTNPSRNIGDVTRGVLEIDTHPPLYFWMVYLWMKVSGDSVFSVRFLSVLMGIFSIFLVYNLTRKLLFERAAVFAALFMAISPFSVRFSQEARVYSLIMALGLCAWLFAVRIERCRRNFDFFMLALLNGLGFYAHYFYIFFILAQFIYFTLAYRKDKILLDKFYLALLGSALLLSPWYLLVSRHSYNFSFTDWIFGYPGWLDKLYNVSLGLGRYIFMPVTSNKAVFVFLLFGGVFLFVYGVSCALKETIKQYSKQLWFCLIMFLVPFLGLLFIDIMMQGALLRQERFWVFPFLGFIPLAGNSLSCVFTKRKLPVYIIILCILVSSVQVVKLNFGPAPKRICGWINKKKDKTAVIVSNWRAVIFAQSYYLNNGIYLLPVSSGRQLKATVKALAGRVNYIFMARHFHPTDPLLMDQPFMETEDIGSGFKSGDYLQSDGLSAREYTR